MPIGINEDVLKQNAENCFLGWLNPDKEKKPEISDIVIDSGEASKDV